MWSYPNLIPLSAAKVERMAEILEPFAFDAIYGSFSGRGQIDANGKQVVAASVALHRTAQADIVTSSGRGEPLAARHSNLRPGGTPPELLMTMSQMAPSPFSLHSTGTQE